MSVPLKHLPMFYILDTQYGTIRESSTSELEVLRLYREVGPAMGNMSKPQKTILGTELLRIKQLLKGALETAKLSEDEELAAYTLYETLSAVLR